MSNIGKIQSENPNFCANTLIWDNFQLLEIAAPDRALNDSSSSDSKCCHRFLIKHARKKQYIFLI